MKEKLYHLQQEQVDRLQEIGSRLRQVRQEKSLSLEDVATKTRIQVRLLKAIEEGRAEILPEPIYIQGFIKRFGDALDLNGEEIAAAFPTWPTVLFLKPSWLHLPTPQLRPVHLYLFYVFLVMGAVNCLSYLLNQSAMPVSNAQTYQMQADLPVSKSVKGDRSRKKLPQKVDPTKQVVVSQASQTDDKLDPVKASDTNLAPKTDDKLDPLKQTDTSLAPKTDDKLDPLKQTDTSLAPTTDNKLDPTKATEVSQPNQPDTPVKVSITVKSASWLKIVADGKTEFEGILQEGDQRTWQAKAHLTVRAGNAGGVLLAYNDEKAEEMGAPSEVKERTFEAIHNKT